MDTLEILIGARAEVEKGWIKHQKQSPEGVCALGAVRRVGGQTVGEDAYTALLAALPATQGAICWFNDAPSTTKQDVLDLFDRAIIAEAVKVTADTAHTFATVS